MRKNFIAKARKRQKYVEAGARVLHSLEAVRLLLLVCLLSFVAACGGASSSSSSPSPTGDSYTPPTALASPSPTPIPSTLDFGGMYGFSKTGSYSNPALTGAAATGCPTGFNQTQILGTTNEDFALFYCQRPSDPTQPQVMDFGGIFGEGYNFSQRATFSYLNPVTGQANCPSGFKQYQILGSPGMDNRLWFCGRMPAIGSPVLLGGIFSDTYPNVNVSPVAATCPNTNQTDPNLNYSDIPVYGTPGEDKTLSICLMPTPSN